jgi:hypothetical protein
MYLWAKAFHNLSHATTIPVQSPCEASSLSSVALIEERGLVRGEII